MTTEPVAPKASQDPQLFALLDRLSPAGVEMLKILIELESIEDRLLYAHSAAKEGSDIQRKLGGAIDNIRGDLSSDVSNLLARLLLKPDTALAEAIADEDKEEDEEPGITNDENRKAIRVGAVIETESDENYFGVVVHADGAAVIMAPMNGKLGTRVAVSAEDCTVIYDSLHEFIESLPRAAAPPAA